MINLKQLKPTKLLWVDLEMTGLDPTEHRILEVALKITDFDFTELASYEALIYQPEAVVEHASEWVRQTYGVPGGLFDQVRKDGQPEGQVATKITQLIRQHFGDEPAVLAGNSIHQDRRFIRQWWPDVDALLHYRMLDVSSWKIVMRGKYEVAYKTKENHRALDDIQESINELMYYLDWLHRGTTD